jgi:hypothetical protein
MSRLKLVEQSTAPDTPGTNEVVVYANTSGELCTKNDAGTVAVSPAYTTGTWTPDLRFGGVTTGITYTSRGGAYTKIADVCFVEGWITLSSKGATPGVAIIAALPFSVRNTTNLYPTFAIQWINMASTLVSACGVFSVNAAHFDVNGITAAAATIGQLSASDFADNTTLRFSGLYLTV